MSSSKVNMVNEFSHTTKARGLVHLLTHHIISIILHDISL